MKRSLFFTTLILLAFLAGSAFSQKKNNNTTRVVCPDGLTTYYSTPLFFDISPPLREMKQIKPRKKKMESENHVIPNNVRPGSEGYNQFSILVDPAWQKQDATYNPLSAGPIQNFEGIGNLDGVMPPDTQGDVGPDYYLQVVNSNYEIFTKTGTQVLGPSQLSTIWTGIGSPWEGRNDGDPIVLYDQAAQRWMISQFDLPSSNHQGVLIAISQTSDPTGSWYRYVYDFGTIMPDYPKFGVWPDGYYLSVNQFNGGSGVGACVWERNKMLTGDPNAGFIYKQVGSEWAMLPSDWDGATAPPANEPNYFACINGGSVDVWAYHTDWTTIANSTLTLATSLTPDAFNSYFCSASRGRCIPQPGTSLKLEALEGRLMFRLQYRNFGTYQSMVATHSVNVDGAGRAGVRWYEFRNTGSGWSIYQQSTWSPDASCRWMGSVAMNVNGDIALGYSVSDATSVYPSIRYTGRRATDPLGQMTVPEQTVINGTGSQTYSGAGRWGDYSMTSVDPSDDVTFWHTNEYIQTTGGWNWQTRVASFKFANNPSVTTTAATAVLLTTATLNGTINPNGLASNYHFDYGTTISYGNSTTTTPAGAGSSSVDVNAPITGLTSGVTYHFRLVGVNSDGTSNGNDMTFTTPTNILVVTPSNRNVPASPAGVTTFDVNSNTTWTASSNQTWCTVTPSGSGNGTITANYQANTTVGVRVATITVSGVNAPTTTVTVSQDGVPPTLSVTPANSNVPATPAGTTNFTVTSNTSWTVVSDQSWCTVTPSGTGNGTIAAAYAVNSTITARVANITVTVANLTPVTVTVTQAAGAPSLAVVPSNRNVSFTPAGTTDFTVTSNIAWTASSDVSWCTVTPSGTGNGTITASYAENTTFAPRIASITVSGTGVTSVIVTVTQESAVPSLTVLPANQDVPNSPSGSTTFSVTSNTNWSVVSDQTWCTVNPSGSGNGTITANYSANTGASSRVANISVTVTGLPPVVVTVTQAGFSPTLSVTPANRDVVYTEGNTTFTVTSNSSWTAASDSAWLTVTPSGTGDGTINAAFLENPYYEQRMATITVTVAGLTPQTVTVTQAPSTVSVAEHPADVIRLVPNPSKGAFRIDAGNMKFKTLTVTITDISGRTILYKVCWEKPDLRFDLSSSPEGSYIVKIVADDQEMTQKLILKH